MIFVYLTGNNFRVSYGFVGNPGSVGKAIFDNSTCHQKHDKRRSLISQEVQLKVLYRYVRSECKLCVSALSNTMDL